MLSNKQKLAITGSILSAFSIIFTFIPDIFYYIDGYLYSSKLTADLLKKYKEYFGFIFSRSSYDDNINDWKDLCADIFGYIILSITIISLISFLINIFLTNKKTKLYLFVKIISFSGIIALLIHIVTLFYIDNWYTSHVLSNGHWNTECGGIYWGSYILLFLLFCIALIQMLVLFYNKKKNFSTPVKSQPKSVNPVNSTRVKSVSEELKEYKELFDSGVITQEEFDAKKKQILGL